MEKLWRSLGGVSGSLQLQSTVREMKRFMFPHVKVKSVIVELNVHGRDVLSPGW